MKFCDLQTLSQVASRSRNTTEQQKGTFGSFEKYLLSGAAVLVMLTILHMVDAIGVLHRCIAGGWSRRSVLCLSMWMWHQQPLITSPWSRQKQKMSFVTNLHNYSWGSFTLYLKCCPRKRCESWNPDCWLTHTQHLSDASVGLWCCLMQAIESHIHCL